MNDSKKAQATINYDRKKFYGPCPRDTWVENCQRQFLKLASKSILAKNCWLTKDGSYTVFCENQ